MSETKKTRQIRIDVVGRDQSYLSKKCQEGTDDYDEAPGVIHQIFSNLEKAVPFYIDLEPVEAVADKLAGFHSVEAPAEDQPTTRMYFNSRIIASIGIVES